MHKPPLAWIREVTCALEASKQIPLYGHVPPFDWQGASGIVAQALDLPHLKLSPRKTQFLTPEHFTSGFGSGAIILPIALTPLVGKAFFVMGKEEVERLTALLLSKSSHVKSFSSPQFQEGFYSFLLQKALAAFNEANQGGSLLLKIASAEPLPESDALCIDVEISSEEAHFWGRWILPSELRENLQAHFTLPREDLLSSPFAKELLLPLEVSAGNVSLSFSQFKNLRVGDFVILDQCHYDPKTHKGSLLLSFAGKPLLRGRWKEGALKLSDYIYHYEEETPMDTHDSDAHEPEENLLEPGEHLWASETQEEHVRKELISAKEIPLTLTVEVDRLQISLEKLLELSEGNILELSKRPEQGVDLTIGGKKVARAELVKIGDALGVKILQLSG